MNNILFIIVIIFIFIGNLVFLYLMSERNKKQEIERLREVVKAIKSEDVKQYDLVLPPNKEDKIPVPEKSPLIPLEEVDPEQLLKIQ